MDSNEIIGEQNDRADDLADMMRQNSEMTGSTDNLMDCSLRSTSLQTGRGQYKRNRGVDHEELWTTIGRKGKRFARSTEIDDSTRVPEENIEVSITCTEKLPKQFKLAKTLKEQRIQDVVQVKYINAYKVLIQLSKEESADFLVSCRLFNENGFRCQKTLEINQSYGVITNIDLDLTDEEILESLTCEALILGIKRLKRRNSLDGRWIASESVRICFKGDVLPSHLYIFDTRTIVNPYIYPVTQCSYCWRYGHSARTCSATKPVCPKCGDGHQNCEKSEFTCNNCGGRHMALAKICPVFVKERKIRELMAECNCTYKQALSLYKPRKPTSAEHIFPTPQDPNQRAPLSRSMAQEQQSGSKAENTSISTYAKVANIITGTQSDKTKKKSKNRGRDKAESILIEKNDNLNADIELETSEEESRIHEEERPAGNRSRMKEPISWNILLKKLKETILENNVSWEEKIRNCISIIFKEVVSFVVHYMSDWPFLNFMNKYG